MKKAALYAQALYEASLQKDESQMNQYFDNFIGVLKKKKEYKLLPAIVREYKDLIARSTKGDGTTLVVRDLAQTEEYKKVLEEYKDTFNTDEITVVEDKTIVGGFIARNARAMLDRSYKKGLIEMYKKLAK